MARGRESAPRVPGELDGRIRKYFSKALTGDPLRVSRLAGDASNRLYYRVFLAGSESRILAVLPAPFDPRELPFLEVAELLSAIPLRVPRVHDVAGELGVLLLEDLGDRLLQDEVSEGCAGERKRALYREALEILARLQLRGIELRSERYRPFRIAFDVEKFFEELVFFRAHFVQGLSGAELSPARAEEIDVEFRELASELASQPYALCHRDYHSRNLILCRSELAVIDFQDARMGPRCYDLVSLLNDSYVRHEEAFVREMKEHFAGTVPADVAAEYDVAALQRNLKALGTFGFQIATRGNDVYRRYLAPTLALVRENLERNPRWDRLRRALARHVPELE